MCVCVCVCVCCSFQFFFCVCVCVALFKIIVLASHGVLEVYTVRVPEGHAGLFSNNEKQCYITPIWTLRDQTKDHEFDVGAQSLSSLSVRETVRPRSHF